jgi:hypothetical protein
METLLNIHNFHSNAKDKDYSVIQVLRDITSDESAHGYIGTQILEEVFLPESLIGKLKASDVGKQVSRCYEVRSGKAYLTDIVVKS